MLYVSEDPWQTDVSPFMVPGWAGNAVTETPSVRAVLVPHAFVAVTEIVPPAEPGVVVMDNEVELPVHPDGKVQL